MKFIVLGVILIVSGTVADTEQEKHGAHVHGKQKRPGHYDDAGEHDEHFDHKAVLGSSELAEEYDQKTPEESKKGLEMLFPKMDANSDGFVDKEELTAWALESFRNLDGEDAMQDFKKQDSNTDNKVTWDEYTLEVYGFKPESAEEMEDYKDVVDKDYTKFKAADVNKDDSLDVEEFKAFTHPYDYEHMHQIELDQVLQEYDNNSDGVVSKDEFVNVDAGGTMRENEIVSEERFSEYDKNDDGVLDKEEMKEWVLPTNKYTAIEEAEHLIEMSDVDHDGKLTKQEIVDHHEDFVGSQVTDYGNNLPKDEL